MNIVVGSVVFYEAKEYLSELFESLGKQTKKDFNILLVNDNIPIEELKNVIKQQSIDIQSKVFIVDKSAECLHPSTLRVELLKIAHQAEYDVLICVDCDDMISSERVEQMCKQYDSEFGFFYNELLDFDKRAVMSQLPEYTEDFRCIGEYNYLGMSNGAFNLKRISLEFIESLREAKTMIFDWYLYSRLLLAGEKGKKINNCYTYYRIYDENLAGRCICTKEALEKEILIKRGHYAILSKYATYYSKLSDLYKHISSEGVSCESNPSGYWWSLVNSNNVKIKERGEIL